jgi:hypothetical protein
MMQDAGWFGQPLITNQQKLEDFMSEYGKMAQRIVSNAN